MENKVSKWAVVLGIVIVLNLFFNYTISLVYKAPQYDDFCTPAVPKEFSDRPTQVTDEYYKNCYDDLREVQDPYNRNVFVALVVLGVLSVLAGNFFVKNEVITNGLALGGLFSFIIASMRYWGAADDIVRVFILAAALGILFWIAYKKFNERIRPERN